MPLVLHRSSGLDVPVGRPHAQGTVVDRLVLAAIPGIEVHRAGQQGCQLGLGYARAGHAEPVQIARPYRVLAAAALDRIDAAFHVQARPSIAGPEVVPFVSPQLLSEDVLDLARDHQVVPGRGFEIALP